MNKEKNIEDTILWKIIGTIMFIGVLMLLMIFLIFIQLNISRFFNYTISGIFIGIIVALFLLLLTYNLVIKLTKD